MKSPPASAGDTRDSDSVPGLGRSPEEGNGNPLQDPSLGNPTRFPQVDTGAWRAKVSGVAGVRHNVATKLLPNRTRAQLLSPLHARHQATFWEYHDELDLYPALTDVTASGGTGREQVTAL